MCTNVRKLFVALCTALPLLVVAPAAPAQTQILNPENRLCSGRPGDTYGSVTLFLPNVISNHYLWWGALVYHYLPDGITLTGTGWTGWYQYTPQDPSVLVGIGGWNHGTYWTLAWTLGYVSTHVYLFDWGPPQQWLYYGAVGPSCLVFTSFQ